MDRRRPLVVSEVDELAAQGFVLRPVLRLAGAGAVTRILAASASVGGGIVAVHTAIADLHILRAREGADVLLEDMLELILDQFRGLAFCEGLLVRLAHGGTDGFASVFSWVRSVDLDVPSG